MNKETLQNYNSRLDTNNVSLENVLVLINKLPENKEIILQDKNIEITENGTQNISADDGYDGLGNVEVVTNVETGGIPKQDGIKTLTNTLNSVLTEFNVSLNNVANTYTKYYNTPVTLYTPDTYYKYYLIRHGYTGYTIHWFTTNMMFRYVSNMIYSYYYNLGVTNYTLLPETKTYTSISTSGANQSNYYSQAYETLEECLQAIQSPTTTYTKVSNNGWYTVYENEFEGIFTNLPMTDNNNFLTVRRLSSDETIEVIS